CSFMAKPKYSPETKLAVVNHYLSGKDGEQSTADLFGIERTSVPLLQCIHIVIPRATGHTGRPQKVPQSVFMP
ncbi:hypothetical protein, partial [Klebsiella pneumoniae]|uniref:hypothetical protein n=1 Tax=Klebsiella pneumoniae TaxID=573 RepID=UPI003976C2AD